MIPSPRTLQVPALAAAMAALAALAGCAPDAWQNVRATGFNDYLDTVQAQCQPLWIGSMNLPRFDASAAAGQDSNYTALLDSASRLYYGRMSAADFRSSVQALAGSSTDARTNRSIDCMVAKLPADRPSSPGGAPR